MLRRTARRSLRENLLTLRALAEFSLAEVVVRVLPLRRAARLLGVPLDLQGASGAVATDRDPPPLPPRAERRHQAVVRVARLWPFGRGPCLRESFVACRLLHRWNATTRLGIRRVGDELAAHAWVEVDGRPLRLSEEFHAFGTPSTAGVTQTPSPHRGSQQAHDIPAGIRISDQ
ncbi:lasso peptide biosynthesis B2 protein [Egibacter rhizosphaerae]|nr:lasso peptide biosynthesis B2 protein [Egibacter rhizosphaerae]